MSDPTVLFLVTVAMFFSGSKMPTSVLCRIFLKTFIPNLVLVGQVMSEVKSFVSDDNDRCQVMTKAHMAYDQVS